MKTQQLTKLTKLRLLLVFMTIFIGANSLQAQSVWDAGRNASSLTDSSALTGASKQYEVDSMTGLVTRKTNLATLKTTGGYELDLTAVYKSYPRHALPSSGNVSNFGMDSVRQFQPLGFGWNLHLGRLFFENYTAYDTNYQQMCVPSASVFLTETQPTFEAPDGSRRTFYRTQKLIDGRVTFLSTDLWQVRCPSANGAWEVYSPNGQKFILGHSRLEPWGDLGGTPNGPATNKTAQTFWSTRVEDKRGNNFSIAYRANTSLIEKISAIDDADAAVFTYSGATEQTYKLSSITSHGRIYSFVYQSAAYSSTSGYGIPPNAEFHLSEIRFPENLKEIYAYHQASAPNFNNSATRGQLKSLQLVNGEIINFEYANTSLPSRVTGILAKSLNFSALLKVTIGAAVETHSFRQDLSNHLHELISPSGTKIKSRFLTQSIEPKTPTQYGLPISVEHLTSNDQLLRVEKIDYNFNASDFPPNDNYWNFQYVASPNRFFYCSNDDSGFVLGGIQRNSKVLQFGSNNYCTGTGSGAPFSGRGPSTMYRGGIRISDSISTTSLQSTLVGEGLYVYSVPSLGQMEGAYIWLPTIKTITEYSTTGQASIFKSTFAYDNLTLNVKKITVENPSGTYVHDYAWCANFSKGITSVPTAQTITYGNGVPASIYRASFNTANDQAVCAPNQVVSAGQTQVYSYLPTGDISTVADALGRTTVLSNYKLGQPRRIDRPDGTVQLSDYDNNGWQTSQTSPDNYVTAFGRDQLGRVTQITHPTGSPTLFSYALDAGSGRYTMTESRAGAVISTLLDGFGRPGVVTKTANGTAASVARYGYTWAGQKQSETYRNSGQTDRTTSFTYDALGRLTGTYFPDSNNSTVEYSGTSIKEKDVRGVVTERTLRHYTANPDQGLPISITNQSVPTAQMTIERDLLGRPIGYAQGGFVRTMLRNSNGCVVSENHPEIGTMTLTPDAKCNVVSASLPGAGVTNYGYDAMDRVTSVAYPDGRTSNFGYWADGKLKTAQTYFNGNSVSRVMDYTPSRKLRSNQLNMDGISMLTRYDYDARDQLAEITYPITGSKLQLNPDALGRPTALQVLSNGQSTPIPLLSNIQYFDSGKVKAITHANGLSSVYTEEPNRAWPDTVGIRKNGAAGNVLTIGQNFDAAGNTVRITDTRNVSAANSTSDRWYRYDGMQRLISNSPNAESANDPCTYCYDGANNINRLKTNDTGQAVNLNYNANNRVSSVTGAASGNISYDARGNITGDGFMAYGFDASNNLTSVTLGTATLATYTYDPKNQRVKQQTGLKQPLYTFYDLSLKPVIEWDRETNKVTEFFYFNGMQISKRTSSPTALTAGNSAIAVQAAFVGNAGQGIIKITLPLGANGNIQIYSANGALIYTGAVTQSQVALPAASLENGCKKYTVKYVGGTNDATFAPGSLGQVTLCKGVDLSPIFQLLLDDNETPPAQ